MIQTAEDKVKEYRQCPQRNRTLESYQSERV